MTSKPREDHLPINTAPYQIECRSAPTGSTSSCNQDQEISRKRPAAPPARDQRLVAAAGDNRSFPRSSMQGDLMLTLEISSGTLHDLLDALAHTAGRMDDPDCIAAIRVDEDACYAEMDVGARPVDPRRLHYGKRQHAENPAPLHGQAERSLSPAARIFIYRALEALMARKGNTLDQLARYKYEVRRVMTEEIQKHRETREVRAFAALYPAKADQFVTSAEIAPLLFDEAKYARQPCSITTRPRSGDTTFPRSATLRTEAKNMTAPCTSTGTERRNFGSETLCASRTPFGCKLRRTSSSPTSSCA